MAYRPRLRTACQQPHPAQSFVSKARFVSATADQTCIKRLLLSFFYTLFGGFSGIIIYSEVLQVASNLDHSLQEHAETDLLTVYTFA